MWGSVHFRLTCQADFVRMMVWLWMHACPTIECERAHPFRVRSEVDTFELTLTNLLEQKLVFLFVKEKSVRTFDSQT